jgi:phage shock protein PspC (stress-responsive transcriptional regulator)
MILPGAIKCKECGSNLGVRSFTGQKMSWVRNFPDRKLLGVASCIAHNLRVSPTLVRLVFVLLTFVSFLGLILYAILAALIPAEPGRRSAFEAAVDAVGAAFDNIRTRPNTCCAGAATTSVQASEFASPAAPTAPPPVPAASPADATGAADRSAS